jgi:hypothetical protein
MRKTTFLASTLALAVTVTGGCAQPDPPRIVSHPDPQPAEAQFDQGEDGDGGAYCQHRRYPCWPWMGGDLTCSTACGYTAQCTWYTEYEMHWCTTHKGQYMPGHGQCTTGGDCWWNTYCLDWNISVAPGGTESTAANPEQAAPPIPTTGTVDPREPSTAAYPEQAAPPVPTTGTVDPREPSTAAYPDVN